MKYLLDSNTCIQLLREKSNSPVSAKLSFTNVEEVLLCSIVKAELFYGAFHSSDPTKNLRVVAEFSNEFRSISFDDAAAETYGKIRSELAARGTPIGPNDLLIAAIALANDLVLVTHNTGEFQRVTGLKIEDWQVE